MNAIQRAQPGQRGTLVVCPTYNEREMLPLFLEEFARTGFECLIVDDGSPDGTGDMADAFAGSHPWCHVLHRPGKAGLGAAYRAGFEWALARGYHAIGQMDCDLSHPPQVLPDMAAALEQGAGLCLASRYVRGGGTAGWSLHRRLLSRAGCVGASAIMGLPYPDLSGGFKLWSADTLRAIDVGSTVSNGYVFQVETTLRTHRAGIPVAQVPFVFRERLAGSSKMSGAIAVEGLKVLMRLRLHGWRPAQVR